MEVYKDSEIEWEGNIPENWQLIRLKDYYNFEKGKNAQLYTNEYIGENEGEYPVYSGQTLNDGIMGKIDTYDYDIDECLFTTTVGANVMTVKLLKGKFSLSQNCLIMKSYKNINNKIIYYILQTMFEYEKAKIPSYMQPSLRIEDLKKYKFYIPDIKEQKLIADFLDDKIKKIDSILENLNKQINILNKYKKSKITEVITKGLDPNVEMKDSGIDWIGKIPKHWKINKLKYVSKCNESVLKENTKGDFYIRYVDIGSVNYENGIEYYQEMKFEDSPSRARRVVEKGNTIISTVRTYLKAIAYIEEDKDVIVSTGFAVLKPKSIIYNDKFFYYYIKSEKFIEQVNKYSYGIAYPAINTDLLNSIVSIIPSKEEQEQIVKYLDKECTKIDKIMNSKQQQINKLENYKKSLIYEYVTGKKRVKGV